MGEVHRPSDIRLDRDVALKILSADGADDPDRLARLQREARAAALNRPWTWPIAEVFRIEKGLIGLSGSRAGSTRRTTRPSRW
jgi:hypothetical protein